MRLITARSRTAEVVAVISNNEGAYAIERAKNHGVPAFVVTPKAYETRDAFNEALWRPSRHVSRISSFWLDFL